MKDRMTLLIAMMLIALFAAACGGNAVTSPAPRTTVTRAPAADAPATKVPTTAVPLAAELPPSEASSNAQPAPSACEEYFGFCVTAETRGAVTAASSSGWGSSIKTDCATWAAGGAARVLEFPLIVGAGKDKLTVALARLGAYTGPGTYDMKTQVASGSIPDMFPAIEVAGRTFSNGTGSTAVVTVATDGSGSLQATGLIEQASLQVSSPDPNTRIDLAMQWTCQQEK